MPPVPEEKIPEPIVAPEIKEERKKEKVSYCSALYDYDGKYNKTFLYRM